MALFNYKVCLAWSDGTLVLEQHKWIICFIRAAVSQQGTQITWKELLDNMNAEGGKKKHCTFKWFAHVRNMTTTMTTMTI